MDEKEKNINFLQSPAWRKFQEAVGRKTFHLENEGFSASIVKHKLPIVGKYFYCPRGPAASLQGEEFPISNFQFPIKSQFPISNNQIKQGMQELIELAKKENSGWIRIDPMNEELLQAVKNSVKEKIRKAPHDMQPREIFVINITKSEDQLMSEMKPKTRYNINLSQKRGVSAKAISNFQFPISKQYIDAFIGLTKEMAARHGIAAHPESYYRKMIETLPEEMLKIYVAEYKGETIAANLVLFYGDTAIYLHGASGSEHRNVMAPFLLQWQAILDAKKLGCTYYDFGGVKTHNVERGTRNDWAGITKFKLGFSPNTKPIVFPGSYDIIISPWKYGLYRGLQKVRELFVKIRKQF